MSSEKRKSIFSKRVTGVKYSKKDSNIQLQDFYTLLFSRENDIQNRDKTDNMAYSLNSYWINSSHNTYLMGNARHAQYYLIFHNLQIIKVVTHKLLLVAKILTAEPEASYIIV